MTHLLSHLRRVWMLPVAGLALVAGVVAAPAAGAHVPTFGADCSTVTYGFTGFPSAPANTVAVTITLGTATTATTVVWNGPDTTGTIPFDSTAGGVVHVGAVWDTNDVRGSAAADIAVTACPPAGSDAWARCGSKRSSTPSRVPVILGGCGTGRTTLLHALAPHIAPSLGREVLGGPNALHHAEIAAGERGGGHRCGQARAGARVHPGARGPEGPQRLRGPRR